MATINTFNFSILISMSLMGSFAALFLKKASSNIGLKSLIFNINLYIGGGLYFLSALLNIYLLKRMEYSVILPLTSITYIWTMAISYIILKENITKKKIGGVLLIVIGAIFVAI